MNKKNESGRSMVEMLGVLAVIGVLSVAGIAGYTTAMRSYRTNEIVNAASMLYVMAMAQNAGNGPTGKVAYTDIEKTNPSGVSTLEYENNVISITFNDEKDCAMAKNKLGEKATDDCTNKKLTVTLGEKTTSPVIEDPEPIAEAPCEVEEQIRCNYTQQTLYKCTHGVWYGLDSCGNPDNTSAECLKGSEKCNGNQIVRCEEGYWGEPEEDTEGKCYPTPPPTCTTGNYKCEGASALYKCVNGAWERYCSCMDGCDHPDEEASNISDVCLGSEIYCG